LKGQYASVRIRDRINEMARFGQQAARLTAEIISEQFQPQTLMDMTNMKLPTQAEIDQQAVAGGRFRRRLRRRSSSGP
jgi:hypothetical protein